MYMYGTRAKKKRPGYYQVVANHYDMQPIGSR